MTQSLLAIVLLTTFSIAWLPGIVSADSASRPNILFILTDDQRFDEVGYMGNRIIKTPNLDKLAAEGVVFNNAFATTAICVASRASILTGQYMRRHRIYNFNTPLSSEAMDRTYPVLLRESGYRTGFLGKWAIGSPQGKKRHLSLPADKFDFWFGFPQSINFRQVVDGKERFLTNLMVEKAIEFLRTNHPDKPFSLSISFKEPHDPWNFFDPQAPNLYENMEFPIPTSYTREDYNNQPDFLKDSLNGSGKSWETHLEYLAPNGTFNTEARTRYRLITGMDNAIGQIMAELEKLGFDDNTIVIFT